MRTCSAEKTTLRSACIDDRILLLLLSFRFVSFFCPYFFLRLRPSPPTPLSPTLRIMTFHIIYYIIYYYIIMRETTMRYVANIFVNDTYSIIVGILHRYATTTMICVDAISKEMAEGERIPAWSGATFGAT